MNEKNKNRNQFTASIFPNPQLLSPAVNTLDISVTHKLSTLKSLESHSTISHLFDANFPDISIPGPTQFINPLSRFVERDQTYQPMMTHLEFRSTACSFLFSARYSELCGESVEKFSMGAMELFGRQWTKIMRARVGQGRSLQMSYVKGKVSRIFVYFVYSFICIYISDLHI